MDCASAANVLDRILSSAGSDARVSLSGPEEAADRELRAAGDVAPVAAPASDPAEMERRKAALADAQRRESDARKAASAAVSRGAPGALGAALRELEARSAEVAALRSRVLELSERDARLRGSADVGGTRVEVTYRGKDLLDHLGPRLSRVGAADLSEFQGALARLRASFSDRAGQAQAILKGIPPGLSTIDEIHLRSAAVGLSVREEPPSVVADAYRRATARIAPGTMRHAIAENLTIATPALDEASLADAVVAFNGIWEMTSRSPGLSGPEDAVRAALMLYPFREWAPSVLQGALTFSQAAGAALAPSPAPELAAAVMVVGASPGGGVPDPGPFVAYANALRGQGVQGSDLSFAAAMLAVADDPDVPAAVARTSAAREYLGRFSDDGMAVPAAMLAVLSPQLGESLDNLRLASAAVSGARLSLGGLETLSLGMKLLLQAAITPGPVRGIVSPRGALASPAPSFAPSAPGPAVPAAPAPQPRLAPAIPIGLLGVGLAMPIIMLPALLMFHDQALHRVAVSDWAFHPVHTGFVYG